jgi:hypothetical protein
MTTGSDTFSRPCPCGAGAVVTSIVAPAQGPIGSYTVRRLHRIDCAECERRYVVDGNSLVGRDDLAAYRASGEAWRTAFEALTQSPAAVEARAALAALLGTCRTKSAAHDYLTRGGLTDEPYGTFINTYPGAKDYAAGVHPLDIPKVLRLLGRDAAPFEEGLAELAVLQRATPRVQLIMEL